MKIAFTEETISALKTDLEIIFLVKKDYEHRWIKKYATALTQLGFKGEDLEQIFLNESGKVIVSIDELNPESLRLAAAAAVKAVKGTFKSAKIGLYLDGKQKEESLLAMCEGLLLADYRFENYKSKKEETGIQELFISRSEYSNKKIDPQGAHTIIEEATLTCEAVKKVRDIVNTPPEEATPEYLAETARTLADTYRIGCTVYDEKWIKEAGMGAFYAVGKGSSNPPRLIHLSYRPDGSAGTTNTAATSTEAAPAKPRARVLIVGKGLTYDTGGLSLKPTTSMTSMKSDKAGAVTALGVIIAAARLKLDIELDAVLGAAENMVSGNSYRPDDILKAKNGKTIEVKNTDAEGRLVLADCLCYAQEQEPDYIIDIATLTGSCVVALGEHVFGIMGHSDELKSRMYSASKKSGEQAHTLPFNRHLKKLLKSEIADISNIPSSRYGGASSAGLFLSEFIEEDNRDKWLHLDIAGPSFVEKEWDWNPAGASGVGVRTILSWLKGL
ncbi:MAG: leucyl aminopeptidase [Spirochaetaceae bacterium]